MRDSASASRSRAQNVRKVPGPNVPSIRHAQHPQHPLSRNSSRIPRPSIPRQVCEERGYYYDSSLCIECPPTGPRVARALGIFCALLLLLAVLAACAGAPTHMPSALKPVAVSFSNHVRGGYRCLKSLNMQPKVPGCWTCSSVNYRVSRLQLRATDDHLRALIYSRWC